MAGGGNSGTQRVINETNIDPVTQQWRGQLMSAGGALYNKGAPQFYPGQTTVPFSDPTLSALDYTQRYAMRGAPNLDAANDAAERGLSGWNSAMPFAANAAAGGLSNNPAIGGLSQFGGASNPYLDSLFSRGAEQVSNAVNANFAQAGRFGPNAAHTGALTRGIGDLYSSIYAPAYETERNRGLAAQQTMGGLFDSGANRQLAGIDLLGGMHAQGNEDAARAMALLPGLYSYGLQPAQSLFDVGGIYEGQAQNYIDADRARYEYNANAPWASLERYANLLNGMPDFSGSSQTTTGAGGSNRLLTGLGVASGLAGLFGPSSLFGGSAGIFGAAGLFSDRRLKRDIEYAHTDASGLRWWRYRYLWDDDGAPLRLGVMADEAPAHAVSVGPGGFLMVDYSAL